MWAAKLKYRCATAGAFSIEPGKQPFDVVPRGAAKAAIHRARVHVAVVVVGDVTLCAERARWNVTRSSVIALCYVVSTSRLRLAVCPWAGGITLGRACMVPIVSTRVTGAGSACVAHAHMAMMVIEVQVDAERWPSLTISSPR